MYVLRQYGMGHAYFRSKFFTDDVKGIYDFASRDFDTNPALVPPMTWEKKTAPDVPKGLKLASGNLSWQKEKNLVYNIYSSRKWPVDIKDASNLMIARQEVNHLVVPEENGRYYAVTAMDRYGNESEAAQSHQKEIVTKKMLRVCGKYVELPASFFPTDNVIVVASVEGNMLRALYVKDAKADVSAIPSGMYQIRSVNRKGVSHRIGFFCIPMH
jgi:hypothetical protein